MTDKATLEFESLEVGYLAKILAHEDSTDVLGGQPIAVTVEEQDDVNSISDSLPGKAETMEENPTSDIGHKESPQKTSISRISPSAKILSVEYGLQASSLEASGPRGTLLKNDVLAAIKPGGGSKKTETTSHEKKPTPAEPVSPTIYAPFMHAIGKHEDVPNSQIHKVIAKRLLESKQNTTQIYIPPDVTLDPVLAFRKELGSLQRASNVKVCDILEVINTYREFLDLRWLENGECCYVCKDMAWRVWFAARWGSHLLEIINAYHDMEVLITSIPLLMNSYIRKSICVHNLYHKNQSKAQVSFLLMSS